MTPEVSGFLRLLARGQEPICASESKVVSRMCHVDDKLWTKDYLRSCLRTGALLQDSWLPAGWLGTYFPRVGTGTLTDSFKNTTLFFAQVF